MCKFCDSNREVRLMAYDNRNSMDICCGQYKGVNIFSNLSMKGNTLLLDGGGSYRSGLDCMYDAEGVEVDNKYSSRSPEEYMRIEFCPFCGKKLKIGEFERRKKADDIRETKQKLGLLKEKISESSLHVSFSLEVQDKNGYNRVEELTKGTKSASLEVLRKELKDLRVEVEYGSKDDDYSWHRVYPTFKGEIRFSCFCLGVFHSQLYSVTENQFEKLISLGLVNKDENKYARMKGNLSKLNREQTVLKERLANLSKQN